MTARTSTTEPIPPRATGPHPTPEEIYSARRAAEANPADAGAGRVLRHAAGCAACSVEMARQEAFDHPEPVAGADLADAWARFGAGPPAPARRAADRRPLLALAAVLALCLVGFGVWRATRGPAGDPGDAEVVRGAEAPAASDAGSPVGTLAAPPAVFVFPAPGQEPRRVKVFDAAQSYSWTSEPALDGRVPFPEAERRRLRPGVEYFWTVMDGGEEGAARSFRIAGKEH